MRDARVRILFENNTLKVSLDDKRIHPSRLPDLTPILVDNIEYKRKTLIIEGTAWHGQENTPDDYLLNTNQEEQPTTKQDNPTKTYTTPDHQLKIQIQKHGTINQITITLKHNGQTYQTTFPTTGNIRQSLPPLKLLDLLGITPQNPNFTQIHKKLIKYMRQKQLQQFLTNQNT